MFNEEDVHAYVIRKAMEKLKKYAWVCRNATSYTASYVFYAMVASGFAMWLFFSLPVFDYTFFLVTSYVSIILSYKDKVKKESEESFIVMRQTLIHKLHTEADFAAVFRKLCGNDAVFKSAAEKMGLFHDS